MSQNGTNFELARVETVRLHNSLHLENVPVWMSQKGINFELARVETVRLHNSLHLKNVLV